MIFTQIWIVIVMNIRSLPGRLGMSLATIFTVAAVMSVLLFFLAMGNGFQSTLNNAGSRDIAIITRVGALSEVNSVLSSDQIKLLAAAPGIARNSAGNPIYSRELYVIVD
ncbi:MAG: ABC transporter permease, partial [Alphaproteobacteria bacterium]|nr:ABC transporter permease [Alphaproteobacteria bacterium]